MSFILYSKHKKTYRSTPPLLHYVLEYIPTLPKKFFAYIFISFLLIWFFPDADIQTNGVFAKYLLSHLLPMTVCRRCGQQFCVDANFSQSVIALFCRHHNNCTAMTIIIIIMIITTIIILINIIIRSIPIIIMTYHVCLSQHSLDVVTNYSSTANANINSQMQIIFLDGTFVCPKNMCKGYFSKRLS